ncbi:MAG TPA: type II secretion system F family protein [Ardenticatenaceae bacterium]|jgi:tight adherence protein B
MALYAIPGLLALSIITFFAGLARILTNQGAQIDDRLERYAGRDEYTFVTGNEEVLVYGAEEAKAKSGFLSKWLEKRAAPDHEKSVALRDELARADLRLKVSEWQMVQFITILATAGVGFLIFRNLILAILSAVLGLFLPRFFLRHRQSKRLAAFNTRLADAIVMLANSLRAGYSLLQSMEVLSQEMPEPISGEFNRVVREVGLGRTQQEGLNNLLRRIPSEDLDMMVTAINVQQEVGGNLAEILDILAHTIRERVRIQGEIRVLVAQQMLAGYVITFLPVALAVVLFLLNRQYMSRLYTTTCGWIMIGTSILMVAMGFFAIQKIVKIEV